MEKIIIDDKVFAEIERIAYWMWEKWYKVDSPQFQGLDDAMGLLSQIDNMLTGLTRKSQENKEVKPSASINKENKSLLCNLAKCINRDIRCTVCTRADIQLIDYYLE